MMLSYKFDAHILCSSDYTHINKMMWLVVFLRPVTGRKRASQGPILSSDEPIVSKRLRTADPKKEVCMLTNCSKSTCTQFPCSCHWQCVYNTVSDITCVCTYHTEEFN